MLQAKHKTGLVFFPAFDWAISPTHPEREERLLYTQDQVVEEGLLDIEGILELKPDPATLNDIQRVHFCVPDVWSVATESHFISAGGAKTIGMAVLDDHIKRGFALVRPPGHHAMRVVHGSRGFCNINIEAVMIEYLRQAYDIGKVAIVDTDCHHGDGTQDIYWHDPDTLFISIHQDGRTLYPGSGFPNELGGPNAIGKTLNVPLPPYTSEEGFLYTVEHVIMPVLNDFKPDIIINSAGQDNHYTDPITNMNFSAQGYAKLTSILKPDIAVLEGGYSIEGALPYVTVENIENLEQIDAQIDEAIESNDVDNISLHNQAFHRYLYQANPFQISIPLIESLWLQLGPFSRIAISKLEKVYLVDRHVEAIDALKQRNLFGLRRAIEADIRDGIASINTVAGIHDYFRGVA